MLNSKYVAPAVIEGVVQFYTESGVDEDCKDCNDFTLVSIVIANGIFEAVDFYHPWYSFTCQSWSLLD